MTRRDWTITDVADKVRHRDFSLDSGDVTGVEGKWSVSQRILRGGLSDGVELVEINNGRMRLFVVPTRGMGIWRAEVDDGQFLGWRSPVRGPVHPKFVPLSEPSGLGWLEGFDELVVRCGLESNGAPEFDASGRLRYPLHGRIANRPAHFVSVEVDAEAGQIAVHGIVEETRFHFQKLRLHTSVVTSFESSSFTIRDEVENFGGTPATMQMLYHVNIGEPLLGAGAQIVAPVQSIEASDLVSAKGTDAWAKIGSPTAGTDEECYFLRLGADAENRSQVLLKNADGSAGAAVAYDVMQLPCFTVWKNMVSSADGYVVGLEPSTNFPNQRSVEEDHGRVVQLPAGAKWRGEVTVDWLTSCEDVAGVEHQVRQLETQVT